MKQNELKLARAKRDAAIAVGVDHADAIHGNWSEQAYHFLERYCVGRFKPFRCEQLRAWAEAEGCPRPPTNRAWGGIMVKGARANLIRRRGYADALCTDAPNTNMHPVTLWEAV